MGQYYKIINITKNEWVQSEAGAKLLEFGWSRCNTTRILRFLLSDYWKGDEVYVVGDYAEIYNDVDLTDTDNLPFSSYDKILPVMEKIYKDYSLPKTSEDEKIAEENNEPTSIYGLCEYIFTKTEITVPDEFNPRYIINDELKEYVDYKHLPLGWCCWDRKTKKAVPNCIDPLTILLAVGNGQGGGDYGNTLNNYNLVGKWVTTVKDIRVSDKKPGKDYKEFKPDFSENYDGKEIIPYTKIPKILKKEQLALDYFDSFGRYNNKRKCKYQNTERIEIVEGKLVYDEENLDMYIKPDKNNMYPKNIYDVSDLDYITFIIN
jgi:hypothetical protein